MGVDGFDDALVVEVVGDDAGTTVVRLAGDIDMLTSQQLRAELARVVAERESTEVVFDVSDVAFVDSSGLSVLIGVTTGGRSVVLRNPSDVVRRVVETSGLGEVLRLDP